MCVVGTEHCSEGFASCAQLSWCACCSVATSVPALTNRMPDLCILLCSVKGFSTFSATVLALTFVFGNSVR